MATPLGLGCVAQVPPPSPVATRSLSARPASLERPAATHPAREGPGTAVDRLEPTPAAPERGSNPALGWAGPADTSSADPTLSAARCPSEMALVDGRVCVDRWEATVVEHHGGTERPVSPYYPLDDHPGPLRAVSQPEVVPQGYISGTIAARACRASGKRLCAADEWELACRGPAHATFPYGNGRRPGVCNDDVRALHPVVEASRQAGLDESQYWREGMNLPAINQLDDSVESTGERAMCTTEDGVYDMVGNLHEWIDDPEGTFRGGFYMDTTQNGEGCSYQTTAHAFGYHDYSTGFRCCMDPYDIE